MKNNDNKNLLKRLPGVVIFLSAVIFVSVIFYKINTPQSEMSGKVYPLSADQNIRIDVNVETMVHVGEPFEYQISVVYRPDKVVPDFRQLVRDVRFVPFEQRHKSRTRIIENKADESVHEFNLSYLIVGVDVIPGNRYLFDDIQLGYTVLETNMTEIVRVQPAAILIDRFYDGDPLGISLQPYKGLMDDNTPVLQSLLFFCLILFMSLSVFLIISVIRKQNLLSESVADQIRNRLIEIKQTVHDRRRKLIEYERLVLSLFKFYANRTATSFWSSHHSDERSFWSRSVMAIKPSLESAYRIDGPEEPDVLCFERNFDQVYVEIEQQAMDERLAYELENHSTIRQRVKKNIFSIIVGVIAAVIGLFFLYLTLNQEVWINQDVKVFNHWLASLPDRLLSEDQLHELNNLDIEMLGHISDEHRVLEHLQTDEFRSAYLYNYATLATNIYKAILLMPPQDEEEEAAEPPTFEFPLLLMANAARFNPDDVDVRRNLEIIIGLKESQKQEESGDVQGELGPPTPGFSRDMNPLLF